MSQRLLAQVAPTDLLYCELGQHTLPASEFVVRYPNKAEPNRAPAYRAYCRACHRTRNGRKRRRAKLRTAGHQRPQQSRDRLPQEVQAALGVLRDYKAQREGKQGYVYLITEDLPGGGLIYGKIGFSTNPPKRVAELQTGNPRKLIVLYAMPGTEEDERRLHAKYGDDNILQEWFRISKELLLEFPVESRVKEAA